MLFICIDTIENDEFFEEFIYDGKETGYMVSNYGRVWSLKTNKFMSYHYGRDGRKRVHLQINGKGKTIELARVIALTFLGSGEGLHADHIDNDPTNDVLSNIQWLTPFENKRKAHTSGSINYAHLKGEDAPAHKYSEELIRKACKMMEDGKNPKEINKETKLPMPVIYEIRYKTHWTHISCEYNIDNIGSAPINRVSTIVGNFINNKIKEGYKNKEIETMLKEKFDIESSYNIIQNRRRRLRESGEI